MNRISLRNWFVLMTIAMVVASLGGVAILDALNVRTDSELQKEIRLTESYLKAGKIHSGQSVREYLALTNPAEMTEFGSFTEYSHGSSIDQLSIIIVSKDGILKWAEWDRCPGGGEYFNSLTPQEDLEFNSLR